jgi:hypothetical protein
VGRSVHSAGIRDGLRVASLVFRSTAANCPCTSVRDVVLTAGRPGSRAGTQRWRMAGAGCTVEQIRGRRRVTGTPSGTAATPPRRLPADARSQHSFAPCVLWPALPRRRAEALQCCEAGRGANLVRDHVGTERPRVAQVNMKKGVQNWPRKPLTNGGFLPDVSTRINRPLFPSINADFRGVTMRVAICARVSTTAGRIRRTN